MANNADSTATSTAADPDQATIPAETPAQATNPVQAEATSNRAAAWSEGFKAFIGTGWADRDEPLPPARDIAPLTAARRDRLSAAFPGKRLVLPAGGMSQRSNDTDYLYRAHSAFSYLTGWGSESEPDSVLVFEPTETGHDVVLHFRERAGRDTDEFYTNAAIGEFWIGARPSLAQVAADLGVGTAHLDAFSAGGDDLVLDRDDELTSFVSAMRLVKDDYEIAQMRLAVDATARGFDDVVADLPRIAAHPRGERLVEGVFYGRARADGNGVGYETIAASGPHACILHWTRNDGPVVPGDLILIDAGVELDSYYTADITRTIPVSGTFTDVQRRVYEAVREAADAAFAIVKPGIRFREVHATAMAVIAKRTAEWGLLPVTAEEALEADNQQHRRYMVHGTSHHLGIDVHDCAQARREMYYDGIVEPGMVFTIEPGLYFQPDDLTVPAEYRGIGVRIEDDILVTADGAENLSAGIPRTADEVEAWLAR
ncbi:MULTISPECIES: aminopeptidase P family protein [unclassified Plantibacter]|uniref:aminopeptidase P family protein n=1 Tax=unclassified Plantibacter TaxID=2624265 RepID=UPI003D32DA46